MAMDSFGSANPPHKAPEMEEGGFSPRQFNPNQSEVRHDDDHHHRKVSDRAVDDDDDCNRDERPKATTLSAAPD